MPRKLRGLTSSKRHCTACANRWRAREDRPDAEPGKDCARCRFLVPTAGAFPEDWGVCANPDSGHDARVMAPGQGCVAFAAQTDPPLYEQPAQARRTHPRWASDLSDDEREDQCGDCRFFIPLDGAFALDWGVCSNPSAARDGSLVFEHDGCDQHVRAATGWGGAVPRRSLQRRGSAAER